MSATPGRKRVGWHEEHPVRSQQSPDDTGSGGHNTPLERSDVSHDDLQKIRASLRLALGDEHLPEEVIQEPIAAPKDVQKPRPAIRKPGPRTPPPEFYLNDQPNPFDDNAATTASVGHDLKERSGLAAQRRAARLSKSVGTYSAPISRRNSKEIASPPVELQNLSKQYPGRRISGHFGINPARSGSYSHCSFCNGIRLFICLCPLFAQHQFSGSFCSKRFFSQGWFQQIWHQQPIR